MGDLRNKHPFVRMIEE